MRTTAAWAFWRRTEYYTFFGVLLLLLLALLYYTVIYAPPTCFDNRENGSEGGVDCGGACERICALSVLPPEVRWARSFEIADGQYNAVAYVVNRNQFAGTPEVEYTFSLYDNEGLITERTGKTILPPDSVYPIFEGRIMTNGRVPTRTFLDIEEPELWIPAESSRDQFTLVSRTLTGADASPRLDATLYNNDLEEAREVEIVAVIFDKAGNALTASRTQVENFAPRSETDIVFTWPQPIAGTVRSCEIPTDVLMGIDLSGSMNDDGGAPPEPISSVRAAAERFVARLNENDQVGTITFATDATLATPLTPNVAAAGEAIAALAIAPREETGATNTGDAFLRAAEEFASSRHDENARKAFVILTDGRATAPLDDPEAHALEAAAALKAAGVEVYAIGLGENVNFDFVRQLASSDEHAFSALTSTQIDRIYETITSALCEDGPAVIEIIPKTEASFQTSYPEFQ